LGDGKIKELTVSLHQCDWFDSVDRLEGKKEGRCMTEGKTTSYKMAS